MGARKKAEQPPEICIATTQAVIYDRQIHTDIVVGVDPDEVMEGCDGLWIRIDDIRLPVNMWRAVVAKIDQCINEAMGIQAAEE